jgi:uncharacterized protein (UPF0333 family)
MNGKNLSLKTSLSSLRLLIDRAKKYASLSFLVFLVIIYGFVFFKISGYKNTEPSDSDVSSQVKAAQIPRINEDLVNQLKSLRDNSVSVQTLFNDARSNPF